ncbi:GIY-YIG nuclease family protein [Kitasatospora sp. NPDC004745]|uniref:GIY-YIG nuclease family protein n=1 Tax=Kitasatospora sp. NPDC004745 TaxID=3364019 RepID=UPI0036AB709B
MTQPQPLAPELERQRREYAQLLRAGMLSPYSLPAVGSAVEEAVLERAWARTRNPFESVGSRIYVLSVAGTHGRVKVGTAGSVRGRIATHLNEYHCNGHGLIDAWISNSLLNAAPMERAIHKLLKINHQPSYRKEEYPDGDFERICALVAELDAKHSLTEEQVQFHEWEQQERMREGGEEVLREIERQVGRTTGMGKPGETASSI